MLLSLNPTGKTLKSILIRKLLSVLIGAALLAGDMRSQLTVLLLNTNAEVNHYSIFNKLNYIIVMQKINERPLMHKWQSSQY